MKRIEDLDPKKVQAAIDEHFHRMAAGVEYWICQGNGDIAAMFAVNAAHLGRILLDHGGDA